MTPKLSTEQRQAIEQHQGSPVYVVDPENQKTYVLIPEDAYQRVKGLLEDEPFDISETYTAQEQVAREAGWDDSEMDVYDDYDSQKPQS